MMAKFVCSECGAEREGRCRPQKCQECDSKGTFEKVEGETSSNGKE